MYKAMNRKHIACISLISTILVYYVYMYSTFYNREQEEANQIDEIQKMIIDDVTVSKDITEVVSGKKKEYEITPNCQNCTQGNTQNDTQDNAMNNNNLPKGFDCIISIPAIDLRKIVYTGNGREQHLENYELITSADDMSYSKGGNYIICGHASQVYGHSLNRLKELKKGSEVTIWHDNCIDQYRITSIGYEKMNNTSQFCQQTDDRQLTIISCAKYIAHDTYIVIQCKK